MWDLGVSLTFLTLIVLFCEGVRFLAAALVTRSPRRTALALETIGTFQLCACTHELRLLAEYGRLQAPAGVCLALTYALTVTHALTARGATCNPSAALERAYLSVRTGVPATLACQYAGAAAAGSVLPQLWRFGLSEAHRAHTRAGFACRSGINVALCAAAAVELSCAFCVHATARCAQRVGRMYRVHLLAAVITTVVFLGGDLTGAVFNPALAFTTQFPCGGNTLLEYSFVYWLGPILGMAGSTLLFERVIPRLSGKSTSRKHED